MVNGGEVAEAAGQIRGNNNTVIHFNLIGIGPGGRLF
jgi:hypothetical protein